MGLVILTLSGLLLFRRTVFQASGAAPPAKVAIQVWEAAAQDGEAEFLVILAGQSDLGAAEALSARRGRVRFVYDALRAGALRSQASLRAELDAAGVDYRAFYIVNMLSMVGDQALVSRLAARSDVNRIVPNPRVQQSLPEPRFDSSPPQSLAGVEWNIATVRADDVWTLGNRGEGIVVAGQDTGYDWDHPALIRQYRGYNGITATHDYNWHDAIHGDDPNTPPGNLCGSDSDVPCDDTGHGTHTMGTIVGDDGGSNQIGVAPGAEWIGCRNMEQGWGTPASYIECFQFFLAPYPVGGNAFVDGDPSLAPHVINNSWTCPPSEGCDWSTLQATVENVRAAGIMIVASAGNDGPGCETVSAPPAIYDAVFSVAASSSSDEIASFSGRGPVMVDGSARPKPDVTAPGVAVRSSRPGTGYGYLSGTSMAAPHVAGTVALLWSAVPSLVGDVDLTEQVIESAARVQTSAQACGVDGPDEVPNNVYGWGIVDALAAVERARAKLEITKDGIFSVGVPSHLLVYTIRITNPAIFTQTQIVVTDTLPTSSMFAWADGDYEFAGDVVSWTAENLAGGQTLSASLAVSVEHLLPGMSVINEGYGVRAHGMLVPVMGASVEMVVPWRVLLPSVFRDRSASEGG